MKKYPSGTRCNAIGISDVSGSGFGTKSSAKWREEKSKSTKSWRTNGHGQGQGQNRGGKRMGPCSKQENSKQGRAIAASVYKNMKTISKQKGEVRE
eukprot:8695194-Ditylum_brightwellii.AAC.1